MSARIARGSAQRARPKTKAPARGGRGKPVEAFPDTVRKVSGWLFVLALLAVAAAALAMLRVPQMLGSTVGEAVGEAGFAVKRVEIKGLERMERLPVYDVALDQDSMAMPLVDLDGTRRRLLEFGWVREARVSRRLPDTLVVDIVERKPVAIWQHQQRLALIDIDGVVLEPVSETMPDLPLVIGPAANLHAGELARLVAAAPRLKPIMAGATWIGGRRWDIRFQSGELLALPEGEEAARKALAHFARMDQATQLLGRGFVRFDMRIPGKFIVRVSREPGSAVPSIAPEAPPAAPAAPAPRIPAAVGEAPVDTTKTI